MLIELIIGVFVFSQVVYALINLIGLVVLYPHRTRSVRGSAPEVYEDLHVLIPIRGESRDVLEATIDNIYNADYPSAKTHVYAIYEADDDIVASYIDEFDTEQSAGGMNFHRVAVNTDDRLWQQITDSPTARTPMTKLKGRALTYALYTLKLDGVVTVLDADTEFEPDLFRRGVAGLEEYDIVQAKQTVRNIDDGILPLWESMGIAAWSHTIYGKTARGPYQLLGKGYFIGTETLYNLHGWNPTDPTEDMAIGIEAYKQGYTLGILDSYIQDLCPPNFWDWVRQKRRWVGGPYRAARQSTLSLRDALRFGSFTVVNQLMSVNHVFGVPAGVVILYLVLTGAVLPASPILTAIVVFNFVMWVYFTLKMYGATRRAVKFQRKSQKIKYYILSNPITQIIYALLWIVPIFLYLFGSRGARDAFIVTPKTVRNRVKTIRETAATGVRSGDTSASAAAFEVYKDQAAEWRWRLVHANAAITADSGEGYRRKAGATNGLESVRRTVEAAPVQNLEDGDDRAKSIVGSDGAAFELYRDAADEWRWRLIHHNGNITADSRNGYERRADAENSIESIKANAPDAVIVGFPGTDSLLPSDVDGVDVDAESLNPPSTEDEAHNPQV